MNEDIILNTLRDTKFPRCYSRKNIGSSIQSFCLGLTPRRWITEDGKMYGISRHNKKNLMLLTLLNEWMKEKYPGFQYTTIQINKNVKCPPHKDKNNVGLSVIVAFGNYIGGELCIDNKVFDIKNKPLIFDGKKEHWTTIFEGERYAIVFFTHSSVIKVQ
jgi:hypothetical protein